MTHIFSRDSLPKPKPRLNRLQIPSPSEVLDMIPEEEEPRSSSSSLASTPRSEYKRTFSTSYIEVSLADPDNSNNDQQDHRPYRLTARPLVVLPRNMAYERSGSTSPTPSTSSASSYAPHTPTSSDDECSKINQRPVSIRPLNVTKTNSQTSTFNKTSFIDPDSDDESDSEWYIQEFSKMIWPLPPSFPKQPPSRPESTQLAPALSEAPVTRFSRPSKCVASRTHKRGRSMPKGALPPIPSIPAHSLPSPSVSPSIPEIVGPLGSPNLVVQPRPLSSSPRRPPPRTSIPTDCLADDFIIGEDQSYWSSDFDLANCEQPSPTIISPMPRRASSSLTVPQLPDSPGSMYSQASALPHPYSGDLEGFGEIEFAVDDVKFNLSIDAPMRLPLSLPSSPIDLEADFTLGLEELRIQHDTAAGPPIIAILDVDEPATSRGPSSSLLPTPSTSASFDFYYDSEIDAEFYRPQQGDALDGPALRSKWSNSTLASVHKEQPLRSKFGAANKFKHYFSVGSSKQQEKQHKRPGSGTFAAAKAAVANAASGAISPHQHLSAPSRSFSSPVPAPPASPRTKKRAQRQVVLVPPSSSYLSPHQPASPRSSAVSRKGKKGWNGRESEVMVIGYGYGGAGKGLGRRATTASDAESEENGSGLKRKPLSVEMFLRGAVDFR